MLQKKKTLRFLINYYRALLEVNSPGNDLADKLLTSLNFDNSINIKSYPLIINFLKEIELPQHKELLYRKFDYVSLYYIF